MLFLIEVAFDALLGCFFELFVSQTDLGDLAVGRELYVEFLSVHLHGFFELFLAYAVVGCFVKFRIDESYELVVFEDDD